jgi:hypothetical protein
MVEEVQAIAMRPPINILLNDDLASSKQIP